MKRSSRLLVALASLSVLWSCSARSSSPGSLLSSSPSPRRAATATPAATAAPSPSAPSPSAPAPSAPVASSTGARDWSQAPSVVELSGVSRILAVGDVHGDYEILVKLLAAANVIAGVPAQPGAVQWAGGQAVLVCTGDLIDKYTDSLDVIALFRALEPQASAAGGRVVVLLGNHEAEFLAGNGVTAKAADFEAELNNAGISPADVVAGQDALGVGAWLRALPMAAKIDDWFFCHAGDTGGRTLAQLRSAIETDVDANGFAASVLQDPSSLVEAKLHPAPWWEGVGAAPSTGKKPSKSKAKAAKAKKGAADEALLASYVSALGAKHLVIGHQPVQVTFSDGSSRPAGAVFANFQGLLFLIDTGMSRGVSSGLGAVLSIDGVGSASATAKALYADGTSRALYP